MRRGILCKLVKRQESEQRDVCMAKAGGDGVHQTQQSDGYGNDETMCET